MSDLLIQPEMLTGAAEQFDQAGKDLQGILAKLDETTGGLKDQWEGAAQQVFYKQYVELRQYMEGFTILLGHISIEMNAMAERYDKADH
jgi:WXG100 family type VII secretion target